MEEDGIDMIREEWKKNFHVVNRVENEKYFERKNYMLKFES